jgi:hypothetical protein
MHPDRRRIYVYEVTRRIGEILHYLWDPIGVGGVPEARDEYDSYTHQVFAYLERGASESEISQYLSGIGAEGMGLAATEASAKHDAEISQMLFQHYTILKKQYEENGA